MRKQSVCKAAVAALALVSAGWSQNAASDWNMIAVNTIVVHGGKNPATAPAYFAYTGLAMFDAANSIDHRYTPFAVSVVAPRGASIDAAVVTAAHDMLVHYFPLQQATLDSSEAASLAALGAGGAVADGALVGQRVAERWIAIRANDGLEAPVTFTPGQGPGAWQLTPPFGPMAAPWLPQFKPFTLTSGTQFLYSIDPPTALNTAQWASDFNTTKAYGSLTGSLRTPAQTEIALFWTAHAPLQYFSSLSALMAQQHLSTSDSARLEAMVAVSLSDAVVSCFTVKYHYAFWRPYTAIRAGDTDGNSATQADPNWVPLLVTPQHPEYPSAHGCATESTMTILAAFFNTDKMPYSLFSSVTQTTHHFERFSDVVGEVALARVYGGIHYPHSVLQGTRLGKLVADQVVADHFHRLK